MTDLYTKSLNKEQLEAVRYLDGPMMIIAGAGSGKTRVLTYKILYLLEHGIAPKILWHLHLLIKLQTS
ncbi:MAG: UvrD-helicase domain-containing protein [Bacteroidales bacterium]|nr:UvrD-helicase domain-containing protein [Bacteroidales bacterium]